MTDERDQSRAHLVSADDPYGDVTGALHDVSNALTVLLGWIQEARDPAATPAFVAHALAVAEQRARTARNLARRAIGAATPDQDQEEDLDTVIESTLGALAVESQRAKVKLVFARRAGGARVDGAEDVSQILTNLVMNALAYSPRGAEVKVHATSSERRATLEVVDEGPGIDPARTEAVFEGSTTRKGGAGVGLRHARALATANGGSLELVPPTPGGPTGARFRLSWPRADLPITPSPMSSPRLSVLAGTRVLIVEDDHDVASLLETALDARGAEVTVVKTAEELHRATATETHDAALIDLSPIAADLEGALGALRQSSPNAQLVFISGSAAGLPDVLAAENVRWVRKPFEVAEIVAALRDSKKQG